MQAFSARYDAALALAARAHRSQIRKGGDTPYIAHVVHVSVLLIRHGFGEDLAVAGLLHDVVEDCGVPLEQVRALFGDEVARLVDAVSERKEQDGVRLAWAQRKEQKLAALRDGGPDVAALKAADAIHNLRSTVADLEREGPAVWARFRGGPAQTLGYYQAICATVQAKLPAHPIAAELAAALAELERQVS